MIQNAAQGLLAEENGATRIRIVRNRIGTNPAKSVYRQGTTAVRCRCHATTLRYRQWL